MLSNTQIEKLCNVDDAPALRSERKTTRPPTPGTLLHPRLVGLNPGSEEEAAGRVEVVGLEAGGRRSEGRTGRRAEDWSLRGLGWK
ncbi:hypothetical protein EYF80_065993 [Liparis tanakae]|uniref:Uncharacterized protein n=1 Tax=Liparis tanakae TaxID=230148 RepID=A0A4Z2E4P7_9TELE|nr:hypothetical protein EYF80_065993 [Liparis tanakae]